MRCGGVVSGRERGGQGPSEEEVERSDERREGNALAWNHRGHIVRARVRISNTDRPAARPITETANTPVFEPRGHPRVDHQVIRNDSSSSSSSSSSSRFFSRADKRIATGHRTAPPPLHLHSAPVREKGVSSSSSSSSYRSHFLISKRSVFVDERIPSKSNPVARGERDTISWRMAVSTFPRIAAREEELDRRTHRCRSDLRRDFRISFPDSREFQHLYPVKTGTEEKREEERSVVATRGYAHARIAVLERPKRDATRRTPPPPWRVRAGKRSRHHGRSSGVAALPTVPSRESYSFSVVGHLSLTRSPHTLANDRLSLAIQLLYVRVAC